MPRGSAPYRPHKHLPDPVGPALGPDPDVGFIAAPAADRRRQGGGPAAGGRGMRNSFGQPTDFAAMAHQAKRLRNPNG